MLFDVEFFFLFPDLSQSFIFNLEIQRHVCIHLIVIRSFPNKGLPFITEA